MNIDRFFSVFKTAASGMAIQRKQLEVSAENIANAYTTKVDGGDGPYKPKELVTSLSDSQQQFNLTFQNSVLKLRQTRNEHLNGDMLPEQNQSLDEAAPTSQVVQEDKFRYEYDPSHPDADENGMVKYPDLDLVSEMTNMVSANRLYEANLSVVEAEKQILKRSLEI